jgi:DNA repair exonuclease SbcCD nuclease subunit
MSKTNIFHETFGDFIESKYQNRGTTKFIHASDIHLGSYQFRNDYRADDYIQAFQEILELAIAYHVDFVILGGDVFTSLEILPSKLMKIIDLLKDFYNYTKKSISIIAIEGNHDIRRFSRGIWFKQRGQSWLKLLASLELIILLDADLDASPKGMFNSYNFKTRKGGKIKIKNVVIYGTRYLGEKPVTHLSKIRKGIQNNDGLFHILIQHFGIEGQMKNVPGINVKYIEHLKHRIDYLALGHFHKQFVIDDWIYNPGSSEAVSSIDNSFKRGVFLVEVIKEQKFVKKVKSINLNNRSYQWKTLFFPNSLRNRFELYKFTIQKLKNSFENNTNNLELDSSKMPILYLILKGLKPNSYKINEKELSKLIIENFPVVDVNIYQKLKNASNLLDQYL